MLKQRLLVGMLALSFSLTGFTVCKLGVNVCQPVEVAAADYSSQFNSIRLAQSYKSLTQNNPCMTQRFTADPGVMEYNGRVYVYSTNDEFMYDSAGRVSENTYGNIKTINCMSSSDLVNWTDHGKIEVAGKSGAAKWAGCSWAPAATHKTINGKEKFFLYFANNACGIGVLTSDSPTGPWVDPIGKPLIQSCPGVEWMFDPAVFVDSDGTGYLYFGGGVPKGQEANPKTARVVKLGSDMTSLAGNPVTIDAPYMFEDSGINKVGDTYYYSYCTNWAQRPNNYVPGIAKIAYMTSKSPMGPFTYQGTIFNNPGEYFGCTGNNHHTLINFKNKWYIFYHSQWLENKMGSNKGYRSTHVDEIGMSNGKFTQGKGTLSGVKQLENLNPFVANRGATMAWQGGIETFGSGANTAIKFNRGDWVGVSNVDFSTGAKSITIKASSPSGAVLKVCTGSASGPAVGYINIPAGQNVYELKELTADISNLSGVKNLFFVASGDCFLDSWKFSKSTGGTEIGGNTGNTGSTTGGQTGTTTNIGETVKLQDGWYYIKNVNAQKYLQVTGNAGKAGQNVEISTGTGVAGQKWYLKNVGDGYVTLKSALGDFMLDVASGEDKDGTNIGIYHAYSGDAQQFMIKKSSVNGAYIIATKSSNLTKVLDDYQFLKDDGTNVCQWSYGGKANQQWIFESINNASTGGSTNTGSTGNTGSTSTTNGKLGLTYNIDNWGGSYQVNFKVTNNSNADVNTWTIKIKKSDINIGTSWNVNVKESGDSYIITPMSYNSVIAKGNSVEFGIQGNGSIGSTINYTLS